MLENTESQSTTHSVDDMRQLIASVLYGGRRVQLTLKGGTRRQVEAVFDEATDQIHLNMAKEDATCVVGVTLEGYNTSYAFATAGLKDAEDSRRLSLPSTLRRQQRRAKARVGAPAEWEIRYVDADGVTVCRPIGDISLDGLSIKGGPADENRFSGKILTPVSIYQGTTKICSLVAELRNVTYTSGQQGQMIFGMSLRALNADDWRAWEAAVNRLLHPTTRDGRHFANEVWELFGKSGYFNLSNKQPEQFAALHQAHDNFNRILEANPELGTHVMWHGGGPVQASLSSCMFYAHTSVLHQGAKAPGNAASRVVLRDMLIHSFEFLKQHPSLHYVAALHNAKVSFNKYAFWDFAEQQKPFKTADLIEFRLFEFDTSVRQSCVPGLTVSEATPGEFYLISEAITKARGPLYADAFDQTPEKLSATVSRLRWRDVGHERERRIYIARDESAAPIAAAVVDVSPIGSNLFSMFDAFTTVSLVKQEPVARPEAVQSLLAVSQKWFSRIGRKKFVWHDFDELAQKVLTIESNAQDLGMGRLWLIKREAIGNLQEFWFTHLMRPREPAKTSVKQVSGGMDNAT